MPAPEETRRPGATCPQCAGEIPLGVAVCPACGLNRVTGMGGGPVAKRLSVPPSNATPQAQAVGGPVSRSANPVQGAVFGLIGAVVGAIAWILMGAFTGYESSYVAMIIGGLVGWLVSVGSLRNSPLIGLMAVGFTIVSIVVARVVIVILAVSPAELVTKNNAYQVAAIALVEEALEKEGKGRTLDSLSDAERDKLAQEAASKRLSEMNDGQIVDLARDFVQRQIEKAPFFDRFFGYKPELFALFCFLGAAAAYGQTGFEKKLHQKKF